MQDFAKYIIKEKVMDNTDTVLLILEEEDMDFLIDEGLWNDCEQTYNDYYIVPKWIEEKLEKFWEERDYDR